MTEFLYREEEENLLLGGLLFENRCFAASKQAEQHTSTQTAQVLGPDTVQVCVLCEVSALGVCAPNWHRSSASGLALLLLHAQILLVEVFIYLRGSEHFSSLSYLFTNERGAAFQSSSLFAKYILEA